MAHMTPHFWHGPYWAIDTTQGIMFLPCDDTVSERRVDETIEKEGMAAAWALLDDYLSGDVYDDRDESPPSREGYLCRLSASGYMDATEWTPCASEEAGLADLMEAYDIDEYGESVDDADDADDYGGDDDADNGDPGQDISPEHYDTSAM